MKQRRIDRRGWIGSFLLHLSMIITLTVVGRWNGGPDEVMLMGGGGGGPIQVELLGRLPGNKAPSSKEIRAPREIRKYEPQVVKPPPEPDALPEPEPPAKKKKRRIDNRPVRAPNVRKRSRSNSPEENTVRMGFGGGEGSGIGSGTGPGYGSGRVAFPYPSWIQIVKTRIQANWRPLIAPVGEPRTYQARVFFRIDRNGNLLEFKILRSSGESLFDQSIERAIRLAAPFPPLPYQYRGRTLAFDLTFRYTP